MSDGGFCNKNLLIWGGVGEENVEDIKNTCAPHTKREKEKVRKGSLPIMEGRLGVKNRTGCCVFSTGSLLMSCRRLVTQR